MTSVQLLFFLNSISVSFNCGSVIDHSLSLGSCSIFSPVWLNSKMLLYWLQSLFTAFIFFFKIGVIIAFLQSCGVFVSPLPGCRVCEPKLLRYLSHILITSLCISSHVGFCSLETFVGLVSYVCSGFTGDNIVVFSPLKFQFVYCFTIIVVHNLFWIEVLWCFFFFLHKIFS